MNKYKFLFAMTLIIATTLNVNSQELNEEFLQSLPDDIKKDLVNKNAQQTESINENYRPYIYSSKLSQAEEILKLKERLERDLLELERRLNFDDDFADSSELVLFGSDFFTTFQTTFMPINEPNPDSGYILDIGDILNIQFVGQKNDIANFTVNGDGSIVIEDIGRVTVAGLSLGDASSLIKSRINSA